MYQRRLDGLHLVDSRVQVSMAGAGSIKTLRFALILLSVVVIQTLLDQMEIHFDVPWC